MNCPCHKYKERLAMMIVLALKSDDEARKLARRDTCVGCEGELGLRLFDLQEKEQK